MQNNSLIGRVLEVATLNIISGKELLHKFFAADTTVLHYSKKALGVDK
ncbi:MAG: hypothetical protein K2X04_11800 [Burkholderiales bacterium]|nr:hypothetical protein [Burkholderiales bacterium]